MKNIFCLLLCCTIGILSAQWNDDFTDGDFLFNPEWVGNVDSFEMFNNVLHLNAPPNTSESYLATNSTGAVDGFWEFFVQLDFNPSNTNKLLVYLISDTPDLKGPLNGYYVQIGGANDQVNLYRQSGNTSTLLIEGMQDLLDVNQVKAKVKVARDAHGAFELFVDTSQNFNNYIYQGQETDFTFTTATYFGFLCDYTATRSDKFYLDDFVVTTQEYVDTEPPVLMAYELLALDEVHFTFNEALDSSLANSPNSYSLTNNNIFALAYDGIALQIKLQQEMRNNISYNFHMLMEDEVGNILDTVFQISLEDNYDFGTILLNEVYPDESPSFGMPSGEFIEIYNPSNDTIALVEWKIADAKDTVLIPNDTILPNSHIILCKAANWLAYTSFGDALTVPNFPSLNNANDEILLLNAYNKVVDSVYYSNAWYREILDVSGNDKKSGGYSLERVSLQTPCANFYNWFPSIHLLGASPGQANSVLNYSFPNLDVQVNNLLIENDTTLLFTFNEEIPGIAIQNCIIEGLVIEQVYQAKFNELYVLLETPLELGTIYELKINGTEDCYESSIAEIAYTFYFNEPALPGDLIFNEILFNPRTGGSDYIELFNTSNKAIDVAGLTLLEYDVFNPRDVVDSVVLKSFVLPPKAYLVLSEDTAHVRYTYIVESPEMLIEQSIPNLNDDESIIALYLLDGSMTDSLNYHKSWHLELLDVQDGVALERISAQGASNNRSNWHSAAKTYAYGTPTAENSQFYEEDIKGKVSVSPEVFTPNEDGYKDFCLIQYKSQGSGELISVAVYDLYGREVRLIAQNHSVGAENTWRWNGLNNDLEKANIGIYLVVLDVFSVEGRRKRYKEKVVLGTQLN